MTCFFILTHFKSNKQHERFYKLKKEKLYFDFFGIFYLKFL